MPAKNKAQEWLQTTILAMGSVAFATTSVAMIYLTSLVSQGRETLARFDAAVDQLMGNAPHAEGSTVAELGPALRALANVLRDVHDSDLANRASVLIDQLGGSYVRVSDSDVDLLARSMRNISQYYSRVAPNTPSVRTMFQYELGTPDHRPPNMELMEYNDMLMRNLENFATFLETSSRQGRGIYAIPAMTSRLIQALNDEIAVQDQQSIGTYKQALENILKLVDAWIGGMLVTSDGNHPRLHNLVNVVPDTVRNTQTGWRGGILRLLGFLPPAQQ